MFMKKTITLILATACTLSLIGCNGSSVGDIYETPEGDTRAEADRPIPPQSLQTTELPGSKAQGGGTAEAGAQDRAGAEADVEAQPDTSAEVKAQPDYNAKAEAEARPDNGTGTDAEKNTPSGAEQSFIGTVLSESTTWMIVEPAEAEEERSLSDRITIRYPTDHYDYLYGEGRRVVIYYNDALLTDSPSGPCIATEDISTEGFRDFELSVERSGQAEKNLILSSDEIAGFTSFPETSTASLYYCGLSQVWVAVHGQTVSLEDALRDGKVTLNGIIQKANSHVRDGIVEELSYDDGGTSVYRYPDYTIIKYHTLSGNRDVYIMSPDVDVAVRQSRL